MSEQGLTPGVQAWLQQGRLLRFRGHEVFMRIAGSGPALLLIHGYPTASYDWHRVWSALSRRHTLLSVDMLGLGLSAKPTAHRYSLATHADLHEWLINRMGLRRVSVMAHDLGVSVAQEMLAQREKNRSLAAIDAVVMLNGGLFPEAYRPRPILRLLSSPVGALIAAHMPRPAFERTIRSLFGAHNQPDDALLDDFWCLVTHREGLRVTHQIGRFWQERLALRERLVEPVLQRRVPLRFINGVSDPNSGGHMADRYTALVPGADVIRLDGVGHWPQLEQPDHVASLALDFLARHARA